ncbi:MAG: triose-phosphate isomerase [Anaerolineaceae bacterium]
MRKPFVAGNWKMNKTVSQAEVLVKELVPELSYYQTVERVFCPPATSLMAIRNLLRGSGIGLGAQNVHWAASGAFTGELSPEMVKEFCDYVIIGHSERRQYFGETDATVNKRLFAALEAGLTAIVCVGETLAENEAERTAEVVTRQLNLALENIPSNKIPHIVIAYEPIWAIGTGKASSAEGANEVIGKYCRGSLVKLYGRELAESVRILYGGSVNGSNAAEYFSMPEIDGALVGGASLKMDFVKIVASAA